MGILKKKPEVLFHRQNLKKIIIKVQRENKTRFVSQVPVVRHLFLAITQNVLGAHQQNLRILFPLVESYHLSYVWALYAEVWWQLWKIPIPRVSSFVFFTFSKLFLVKTQIFPIFLQLIWNQCKGIIKCFHLRPCLLKSVQ